MATVVYGGSPRHSSSNNPNRLSSSANPHNLSSHHSSYHSPHSQQQQIQQQQQQSSHHHNANMVQQMCQASYISSQASNNAGGNLSLSHHYHHSTLRSSKRKSAVEMLAESKPFYVKSETVLDRQQQLNIRGNSNSSSYILSPSRTLPNQPSSHSQMQQQQQHLHQQQQQQQQIQQQSQPHHHYHRSASRRSASSGSDLLQTKLRKLLNTDSREVVSPDLLLSPKYHQNSPNYIGGGGVGGGLYQPNKNYQQLTVHPEQQSDVSVFFPSAFLSPQSLPPNPVVDDDLYSFGIDDNLVLTDDYRAISPPAEYAENNSPEKNSANRYGYQRSYSHSQAVDNEEPDYSSAYNINSHKSLPDLHSQISRHSPHSEALSCCSRGNRSNRSGSSFNRDSGGSSGHYTHRSEPCKQKDPTAILNVSSDFRRDSGSSTQHSGNSYYAYGIPPIRYDCIECRAKIREEADCLLNFTTPEVPEAFQDDYGTIKAKKYYDSSNNPRKYYNNSSSNNNNNNNSSNKNLPSPLSPISPQELSPPLGTFKRQKCLRLKNRGRYSNSPRDDTDDGGGNQDDDRRPILRSKSDISDRYWNRNNLDKNNKLLEKQRQKSESLSQLEHFFDRLGLDDENYEKHIAPNHNMKLSYSSENEDSDHSSAVFFSDVSTIDSTRLPDSTETQNQTITMKAPQPQMAVAVTTTNTQMYRPSEPPSIVERNARIIKWLCNCKKLQLT